MESSQDIRHRTRDDQDTAATATVEDTAKARRTSVAKGGLKSLTAALLFPFLLTAANIYMFGASDGYRATRSTTAWWVPPLWALHGTCLASSLLMGAAGWMFWAQDGLKRAPQAAGLYVAQLALGLLWDPLVFRAGASWAGLAVAGAVFGVLWRCGRVFKEVSPVAADLVKPCLAWAGFLAFVSIKLMLASYSAVSETGGNIEM